MPPLLDYLQSKIHDIVKIAIAIKITLQCHVHVAIMLCVYNCKVHFLYSTLLLIQYQCNSYIPGLLLVAIINFSVCDMSTIYFGHVIKH